MKNYIKDSNNALLKSIVFGVVIGFAVMGVLTICFSFAVTAANATGGTLKVFSMIIIGLSALISGFAAAKKSHEKILLAGLLSGALLYFLIGVVSMIITKNAFSSTFVIRLLISVSSASLGAILSAMIGSKNKYI